VIPSPRLVAGENNGEAIEQGDRARAPSSGVVAIAGCGRWERAEASRIDPVSPLPAPPASRCDAGRRSRLSSIDVEVRPAMGLQPRQAGAGTPAARRPGRPAHRLSPPAGLSVTAGRGTWITSRDHRRGQQAWESAPLGPPSSVMPGAHRRHPQSSAPSGIHIEATAWLRQIEHVSIAAAGHARPRAQQRLYRCRPPPPAITTRPGRDPPLPAAAATSRCRGR